ncbi:hypothetical protein JOF56_009016 [Kibdelosporangium banguiense]|uniref:DUF6292 domain-containing protein n=1 Tax=Kibdelosporangium banguiense TaxID=1365924 RepID=A0ABS4TXG8_9PSEU|nr:DUF6292 family protein [Kibdelosporangium banguiense]MBP2328631.1 hypothetical protein [Kibdelosporangium banguiense]
MTQPLHEGDGTLGAGLQAYAASVADAVGVGLESCCLEADEQAMIYLAVDNRVAGFTGRDAALLWDEQTGWAVAMESASGEDLIVVAVHQADLLPAPAAVARWLTQVTDGAVRSVTVRKRQVDRAVLTRRLSRYVPAYRD